MKKAQAALALALLGAVCSLCLRGMKRIGESMDRDEQKNEPGETDAAEDDG